MSEYYERVKFPCGLEYEQKIRAIIIIDKDDSEEFLKKGCPLHGKQCKKVIKEWMIYKKDLS